MADGGKGYFSYSNALFHHQHHHHNHIPHHDHDWAPSKRSHRMMSVSLAANLDLTLTVNPGYLYDHLDHDNHLHVDEEYDQTPSQPWLSL